MLYFCDEQIKKVKSMKKTLFILIALLSIGFNSAWSSVYSEDNNIKINKGKPIKVPEERPRDLIQVPIACFYSDGSLFFTFMEDLGELEISVTNLSTGAEIIDEIDSFCGNAVMEVPESSGEYQIEITTETGEAYYGEYTL